jgi:hypothetical protein
LFERARRFLNTRRDAYARTFSGPVAEPVLKDLATFCFAHGLPRFECESDFFMAEGRRQVWQRIAEHTNLTEEQLWDLYDGRQDVQER